MNKEVFLRKLQEEAAFQAQLSSHRLLPKRVDRITSFIGTHSWQTLLSVALVSALLLELIEKL